VIAVLTATPSQFQMAFNMFKRDLESYHGGQFLMNYADNSWRLAHIKVIAVHRFSDVQHLKDYQLIKYDNFMDNPDAEEILQHYEHDVNTRLSRK